MKVIEVIDRIRSTKADLLEIMTHIPTDLLRWFACDCAERTLKVVAERRGGSVKEEHHHAIRQSRAYALEEITSEELEASGDKFMGEGRASWEEVAWGVTSRFDYIGARVVILAARLFEDRFIYAESKTEEQWRRDHLEELLECSMRFDETGLPFLRMMAERRIQATERWVESSLDEFFEEE